VVLEVLEVTINEVDVNTLELLPVVVVSPVGANTAVPDKLYAVKSAAVRVIDDCMTELIIFWAEKLYQLTAVWVIAEPVKYS
jgi:hypothetical protein